MLNKSKHIAAAQPIVCVGFPRWEGTSYLSSTVQLMSELAQYHPILYVDYPFTYKDIWLAGNDSTSGIPIDVYKSKKARLQERDLKNACKIHLLRLPPFIPANFLKSAILYDNITAWNGKNARKAILKALAALGWQSPIVINAFNPALGNALAGKLGESQLVYYCYDEIGAAPWIGRHGARHERIFLNKVDQTIVSSTGLYTTKHKHTKACNIVKNGVDLHVFSANGQRPTDLPDATIIGYIGSVDSRLDYELLIAIAKNIPQAHLVMLGRIMDTKAAHRLKQCSNIHLLGTRPIEQLGNYLKAFDVGLIPFAKNELTAGIYPLKINEYLALGVPVVSTDFAGLSDFSDVCSIAEDHFTFISKLQSELIHNAPDKVAKRKTFASQNTWKKRAEKFSKLLLKNQINSSQETNHQETLIST